MTTLLFSLALVVLTVALIAMSMTVRRLSEEIDELKAKLEQHRIRLNYLNFDYLSISDIEKRLDQLEEALELKEYFDKESLNK